MGFVYVALVLIMLLFHAHLTVHIPFDFFYGFTFKEGNRRYQLRGENEVGYQHEGPAGPKCRS